MSEQNHPINEVLHTTMSKLREMVVEKLTLVARRRMESGV